jgi:hypothetical protein
LIRTGSYVKLNIVKPEVDLLGRLYECAQNYHRK